jgi:hypothetical protein
MARQTTSERWKDVTALQLVELGDKLYSVVKIKDKGEGFLKVTVKDEDGDEFSSKVRAKDPVEVVELVTRREKDWSEPDDQAERNVVSILGGNLQGVQVNGDEVWICPIPDLSTITAHLMIFHGIDFSGIREVGGYDRAVEAHDADREHPLIPHRHEANRPATTKGPRFQ